MNRKILITCLVLVLVVCLVLSVVSIVGAGVLVWRSANTPDETATIQKPDPVLPNGELNPAVVAEMELIQRQVIQERGLDPNGEFVRIVFTPEQLRQRVLDDFLEDYSREEAQQDVIVLSAFGLIEPDFEFYDFYTDLLSEQIAGFYDNETKEMAIVQGEGWGGPERLTYAHEYTHALQDQAYDIRQGLKYSDEACEDDSERCAAIQALLEGDASLSEMNWFMEHGTSQDRTEILSFYDNFESPVFDSSPAFLHQDFLFPYEKGLEFVEHLYDRGGWDAVDQAYAELPVSTEQILHPERYPHDVPIPVSGPDLAEILGDGWEEIDQGVMGEWYTYLILAHGLDEDARIRDKDARDGAEGWGGDFYAVFHHPEDGGTVMVMNTVWESESEAGEFADAFETYARDRFGKPLDQESDFLSWQGDFGVHFFHLDGPDTIWVLAPDEALADLVLNAVLDQ